IGDRAEAALRAPGTVPAEDGVPLLVNDLSAAPGRVVLVLDDYHLIRSPDVHDSVLFLVEHLPATLHLAIATRADPPLPLAGLRAFVLCTSILDRLSGPLCAAVAQTPDASRSLDELERANLFLVPLDANRRWYRYHQLFAELLRRRLEHETPELVRPLHERA